jgi:hypothetical protein
MSQKNVLPSVVRYHDQNLCNHQYNTTVVAPSTLFKFSITEANSLVKFDVYGSPLKLSLTLSGHSFSLFEQDQKPTCPSYKMQTFLKGHETKLLTKGDFKKLLDLMNLS